MKNLKANKGIPIDIFEGNPALSNPKLLLIEGKYCWGYYSYATSGWCVIEEFKKNIGCFEDTEVIWFEEF